MFSPIKLLNLFGQCWSNLKNCYVIMIRPNKRSNLNTFRLCNKTLDFDENIGTENLIRENQKLEELIQSGVDYKDDMSTRPCGRAASVTA